MNLNQTEWELADQIGRLNQSMAKAVMEGQDMRVAEIDLRQATAWFNQGYYSISDRVIDGIRADFPHLFVAESQTPTLLLFALASAYLISQSHPKAHGGYAG